MNEVKYIVKPEVNLVVCIIREYGYMFRGVAKCSPDDKFDEATGKKIAYLRACEKRKRAQIREVRHQLEYNTNERNWYQSEIDRCKRNIDKMLKTIAKYREDVEKLA